MVGSVEQIAQNLAALDQQISAIAEEFYETYLNYATALGQTVRQQLVLSCYHVCTEGYPEAFLNLSISQRQQLQQDLRNLAKQSQAELVAQVRRVDEAVQKLESDSQAPEAAAPEAQPSRPQSTPPNELELLLIPGMSGDLQPSKPPTPLEALTQWQDKLERAIVKQLQLASHMANRLLQQAEILPKRLPEPVLEAAAKAEADSNTGTPNLLTLLVEATGEDANLNKPKDTASLLQVIAVHLRLAEIEFNDPTLMLWRNKLRDLKQRFKALGHEYQQKQKECTIAQAQNAWRSTWSNE